MTARHNFHDMYLENCIDFSLAIGMGSKSNHRRILAHTVKVGCIRNGADNWNVGIGLWQGRRAHKLR